MNALVEHETRSITACVKHYEPGDVWRVALAGAALLLAAQSGLSAVVQDQSFWKTSWMLASIFMGKEVIRWPAVVDFAALTAALTALYPVALAFILTLLLIPDGWRSRHTLLVGAVLGLAFCWINLQCMARCFPWLAGQWGWTAFASYAMSGAGTAWIWKRRER